MTMKTILLSLSMLLAIGVPASAHHSFAAVFDAESPVEKSGTVTEVEWMNPHAWIYIDVEQEDGSVETWAFELGSPNGLIRRGWTRGTVQIGDVHVALFLQGLVIALFEFHAGRMFRAGRRTL